MWFLKISSCMCSSCPIALIWSWPRVFGLMLWLLAVGPGRNSWLKHRLLPCILATKTFRRNCLARLEGPCWLKILWGRPRLPANHRCYLAKLTAISPRDVLSLAVLLSGKVGNRPSSCWPAAAPAVEFWLNVFLSIALMLTCVHLCMLRISDKQSEVEAAEDKMLGVLFHLLAQNRAVFSWKKHIKLWQHSFNPNSSSFDCPCVRVWKCSQNISYANCILGILFDVCVCVPRMKSKMVEVENLRQWLLGIPPSPANCFEQKLKHVEVLQESSSSSDSIYFPFCSMCNLGLKWSLLMLQAVALKVAIACLYT